MNASDFNARMAALPEPLTGFGPPYWQYWQRDLWEHGKQENPNGFMGWPCVYHTMLVNHWSMDWQFSQLESAGKRWLDAASVPDNKQDLVGEPMDFYYDTFYSKNLINLAYHFLQWEQRTGRKVSELNSIVEWGGGYGGQALVARRLGFTGKYTIYDLPEFSLLQEWFLGEVGVEATLRQWPPRQTNSDLLIAIYSLSEMPLMQRFKVLEKLNARSYLMVYSPTWEDYDNEGWFFDWAYSKPEFTWRQWPMSLENERPDLYCVGWRG